MKRARRHRRSASARVPLFSLAVLTGLALLPLAAEAAQQEAPRFRHLTSADGLSQNAVYAILQDRRGFMWFGTKDGLNRYDGYRFVVHRYRPGDTTSLSDNHITALWEHADGALWVGTRNGGLNRFDRATETFRRYPDGPERPITALAGDEAGGLWIGTEGAGLYRMTTAAAAADSGSAPRFVRWTHDPADPGSLSHDRVRAVLVDRGGTLWVGTDAGLDRLERSGGREEADGSGAGDRFVRHALPHLIPSGPLRERVSALLEDGRGRLWIGTPSGLRVLSADRSRLTHHPHRYRSYRYGWGEPVQLLEDGAGLIWVSTHAELMRFDPSAERFSYLRHDRLDPEGINSDSPTALFLDRSGVLWVGTNGFGLNVHDTKAGRFRTFRRPEDRPYRLAGFSVYTLFEDSEERVWINAGLLYRWDRRTGEFVSFETSSDRPEDFGNTGVWAMLEDPPGFLWAGTYEGLYHYEISTGRYRRYAHRPGRPDGLPEKQVKDIHLDPDGTLWVATVNYLARLEDPEAGRFRSYRHTDPPADDGWTFPSLHRTPDGALWLGSDQGLVRFDPETERFTRYRHDPGDPDGLAHDVVRAICPDPVEPERYLWLGTAGGGLQRLDLWTDRFQRWTVEDGLPNDVVYGALSDGEGRLWLSTNRGLSRFDPRTGEFRNFDAHDGLQGDEFNSGAYFRSPSGEMFFGGLYGFDHFRPEEIRDNPHVPPIAITAFRRNNRPESVRDSGTVLPAAISETDTLRLSYRDDAIGFEFAALDFSAPAKNRYAYRLVGFDEGWIEAGPARSAAYTNLPPGAYTFRVRGSNNDGVWNEEGASLAVLIAPPWWRTPWAYGLWGLLALSGLWAARRYELGRLRLASRLEVERVEAQQLRELDRARSRFFANISHEFRTPLTLTLGPLDDLRAGLHGPLTDAVVEQVELARRSAGRVLDLIEQILELARLESGRTPLRARRLGLGAFVREVARSFAPLAERKTLTLEVQIPETPAAVYADPEALEKILANLLSNALKFTPEGGRVRVSVEAERDAVRVAVRDSGPGVPAVELARVFDRFHRVDTAATRHRPGTGIGLALAKELAELHGGSLTIESEEGFGSTFTLSLRRGTSHLTSDQIVPEEDAEGAAGSAGTAPSVASDEAAAIPVGEPPRTEPDGETDGEVDPAEDDVTTVLVVEDDAEVRAYVRRHLEPDYRVLEAADGERGLELTRRRLPDLVLSDVMMPGADGHELCRALKADPETDFIPVVLLTARAAAEDRLAGLRELADDYLTKPFDVRELRARIDNLIASRKRLRERFAGQPLSLHPSAVEVEPADERFLERVRAAIEGNLGDETFSVERLAREVAHSRGHLHRRLRALLDETPSGLIRRMRLERAAQLIEAEAGSIGAVAYAVGFKSVAHFSNSFLEQFGVRPSAYRAEGAEDPPGRFIPA